MAILSPADEIYIVGAHKGNTQASIQEKITQAGGTKAAAVYDHTATHPLWVLPLEWLSDSIERGRREDEAGYDLQNGGEEEEEKPPLVKQVGNGGGNGNGKGKGKRAASPEEDEAPTPAPKLVKAVRKGGAPPVDSRFDLHSIVHVYAGADGVYYAPQDFELNDPSFSGQQKVFGPYGAASQAISEFEKKFKDKTKNTWANRHGPQAPKKYTYIERSFDDDEQEQEQHSETARDGKKKAKTEDRPAAESNLKPRVQELMRLIEGCVVAEQMIFDVGAINQTMSSMEYDAAKLPLGKLSKSTMDQGFATLKEIAAHLGANTPSNSQDYEALTNRYYSLVPHAFGRHKPPVINTQEALKREIDLIEALGQLKITSELMNVAKGPYSDLHPLDAQYHNLGLKQLDPIDPRSGEYETLEKLLKNTKGETHNAWDLRIVDAFKVKREKEEEGFRKAGYESLLGGQRRLLWHGSRSSNYGGILSQGLRIAPPEAPVSGYVRTLEQSVSGETRLMRPMQMFGKGLYLASMASKSAGYCYHSISGNEGLLMLVEAQLGPSPFYRREQAEYEANPSHSFFFPMVGFKSLLVGALLAVGVCMYRLAALAVPPQNLDLHFFPAASASPQISHHHGLQDGHGHTLDKRWPVIPAEHRLRPSHTRRGLQVRSATGRGAAVYDLCQTTHDNLANLLVRINATVAQTYHGNYAHRAVTLTSLLTEVVVQLEVAIGSITSIRSQPTPSGGAGGCNVIDSGILDALLLLIIDVEYTIRAVESLFPGIPLLKPLLELVINSVHLKLNIYINILNLIYVCLKVSLIEGLIRVGLGALVGVIV
ncbi:hypothetical protein P7C70_g1060, partial [Phenoliferia sp. Uapishka_3]